MKRSPLTAQQVRELAVKLCREENAPHWDAIGEYRIAPSEETAERMFVAIFGMAEVLLAEQSVHA